MEQVLEVSSCVSLSALTKLTSIKLGEFMLYFSPPFSPTQRRDYVPYKIKI